MAAQAENVKPGAGPATGAPGSAGEGVSANLFYNLGNAWFRAGQPGQAVLNYKRALRLQPGHPEAAANLAFIRRQLGVPTALAPVADTANAAIGGRWKRVALVWSPWLLAAGGWLLLGGLLIALVAGRGSAVRRNARTVAFAAGLPLVVLGALAFFWLADRRAVDPARAVLVGGGSSGADEGIEARYAPADTAKVESTLPVGGEVRLLQERGAWNYVELPGGTRAWIAAAQVERIALF